ncbi:MAG: transcription antitermination factor NusB [Micrococcales bacterium]|nr:transcription antitermination factor NusB [Micrococcales bacterium]
MSARTKARKRAVDLLYGADVRSIPVAELLAAEAERAASQPDREASWQYARQIVEGVDAHADEIDATIRLHAQGWTIERMPVLDRAIARVGAWEILYNPDVPDPVAISEAVESATTLSTEDSAGFLNGLLAAIARDGA